MSEVSSQQHLDKPKQGDVRGEKHGEEDEKLKKKKSSEKSGREEQLQMSAEL